MRKQAFYGLASALVLSGLIASFSAPQELVLTHPRSRPRPVAGTLEPAYRLRLTSTWPQWEGAPARCAYGGLETVEGVLVRTGYDSYSGTFTRRTRLIFCGSHGSDAGTCELILEGKGRVAMTGLVVPDELSPTGVSARLAWVPTPDHEAVVQGLCAPAFKQAVERMYLTVQHGAEVPLPVAGGPPIKQQLENYAYVAEID